MNNITTIFRGVKLTPMQALTARGELAMLLSRKLEATGEDAFNKEAFPLEVLVARAEAENWETELKSLERALTRIKRQFK